MISQTKPVKITSFLSFNFVITKTCVVIRLAEDGKTMDSIWLKIPYPLRKNINSSSYEKCILLECNCLQVIASFVINLQILDSKSRKSVSQATTKVLIMVINGFDLSIEKHSIPLNLQSAK